MVAAVRTTKSATQNDLPAPSGHHHCPRESTSCAPSPHLHPLAHPLPTTKARAAQLLEAPCRQTRARRARFDSGPKRQITLKGSAQGTCCLLWGRSSSSPASQSEKHAFRRGTSCFVARERLEGILGGSADLLEMSIRAPLRRLRPFPQLFENSHADPCPSRAPARARWQREQGMTSEESMGCEQAVGANDPILSTG